MPHQSKPPQRVQDGWSRRDFLKISGAGIGAAGLLQWRALAESPPTAYTESISFLRPEDLLGGRLLLFNLRRDLRSRPIRLWRVSAGHPVLIALELPTQHIAEEAGLMERHKAEPDGKPITPGGEPDPIFVAANKWLPCRGAGPSRLVFELSWSQEDDRRGLPCSLEAVLRRMRMGRVRPCGIIEEFERSGFKKYEPLTDKEPALDETAIELPYRLWLSPGSDARFYHAPRALSHLPGGERGIRWIELWHTALDLSLPSERGLLRPSLFSIEHRPVSDEQLGEELRKPPESREANPRGLLYPVKVRPHKPWTAPVPKQGHDDKNDYGPALPPPKMADGTINREVPKVNKEDVQWPADQRDLADVLEQMRAGNGVLRARELILTPLGASTDLDYRSVLVEPGKVRQWLHRTAIGRDQFVQVVTNGMLYPFLHQAVFVRIWERKLVETQGFTPNGNQTPQPGGKYQATGAYVLKRQFIIVMEPEKRWPTSDDTDHPAANAMVRGRLFTRVQILTTKTPNLNVRSERAGEAFKPTEVEERLKERNRPEKDEDKGKPDQGWIFWPRILDEPYQPILQFECEGEDIHGNLCRFVMPMLYAESVREGETVYRGADGPLREATLGECPLAFAPMSACPIAAADLTPEAVAMVAGLPADLFGGDATASALLADLRNDADARGGNVMQMQARMAAKLNALFDGNELSPDPLLRTLRTAVFTLVRAQNLRADDLVDQQVDRFVELVRSLTSVVWDAREEETLLARLELLRTVAKGIIKSALTMTDQLTLDGVEERLRTLFESAANELCERIRAAFEARLATVSLERDVEETARQTAEWFDKLGRELGEQINNYKKVRGEFDELSVQSLNSLVARLKTSLRGEAETWHRRRLNLQRQVEEALRHVPDSEEDIKRWLQAVTPAHPEARALLVQVEARAVTTQAALDRLREKATQFAGGLGRLPHPAAIKFNLVVESLKQQALEGLRPRLAAVADASDRWPSIVLAASEELRLHRIVLTEKLNAFLLDEAQFAQLSRGLWNEAQSEFNRLLPEVADRVRELDEHTRRKIIDWLGANFPPNARADWAIDLQGIPVEALMALRRLAGNAALLQVIAKDVFRSSRKVLDEWNEDYQKSLRSVIDLIERKPDPLKLLPKLLPSRQLTARIRHQLDGWQTEATKASNELALVVAERWFSLQRRVQGEVAALVASLDPAREELGKILKAIEKVDKEAAHLLQDLERGDPLDELLPRFRQHVLTLSNDLSNEGKMAAVLRAWSRQPDVLLALKGRRLPLRVPDPALVVRTVRFQVSDCADRLGGAGLSLTERVGAAFQSAVVEVPAIKRMDPAKALATIEPYRDYVEQGFARMRGGFVSGVRNGIYAQLAAPLQQVGGTVQAAVLRPVLQIAGLSREMGAVIGDSASALDALAGATKRSFEGIQAQLGQVQDQVTKALNDATGEAQRRLKVVQDQIEQHLTALKNNSKAKLDTARDQLARATGEEAQKLRAQVDRQLAIFAAAEHAVRQAALETQSHLRGRQHAAEEMAYGVREKVSDTLREQSRQAARWLEGANRVVQGAQDDAKKVLGETRQALEAARSQIELGLRERWTETEAGLRQQIRELQSSLPSDRLREMTRQADELKKKLDAARQKLEGVVAEWEGKVRGAGRDLDDFKKKLEDRAEGLKDQAEAAAKDWLKEAGKEVDIAKWLPDLKLLGSLNLAQLLTKLTDASQLPKIITKELPERVETSWQWSKELEKKQLGVVEFIPSGQRSLRLDSRTTLLLPTLQRRSVSPPEVFVAGRLDAFTVILSGMIQMNFGGLDFQSGTHVETKMVPGNFEVEFIGALAFVAKLQELLSRLTGVEGLHLRVTSARIEVGLELELPALSFGAFSLSHLRIITALSLPLGPGTMKYIFSFCERDRKFLLSVSGFAGMGYLRAELDGDGHRAIEGAFEFGGAVEFAFGAIAEGGLYIVAGIFFRFSRAASDASGYLRAGGRLRIIGMIDVSVEIILGLHYQRGEGRSLVLGYGELRVSIKIFFARKTFTIGFERKFAGSSGGRSQSQTSIAERDVSALAGIEDAEENLRRARGAECSRAEPDTPVPPDERLVRICVEDWRRFHQAFDFSATTAG